MAKIKQKKTIKAFACFNEDYGIDEIWAFPSDWEMSRGGTTMLIFHSKTEAQRRAKFDSTKVVPVVVSFPRVSRAK